MEFSSLVNQQRIRERFGKLNQEQLAQITLVDFGKDINSLTAKDLQDQILRMQDNKKLKVELKKCKIHLKL